jgi:hypothetical protein
MRYLKALSLALILFAAPVRAEQGTIVGPIVGPKTMTEVMTVLNAAMLAIQSCNSGTSAPANGVGGTPTHFECWADTTSNPVLFKRYDNTSWVTFGALDTSTHVWTPYRNGSPIAAVATSSSATDLTTGTLPAARLPVPSASTLGGVQSKSCSASQWLNVISTSGVPSCTQPNFTDLAGTASLAQLPAFSGMSAAAAAADADTFPTNQGAGNLKQTLAAIKTWVKAWIVKADVALGNVDNTSDATKWAAAVALTNKDLTSGTNTFPTFNQNTTGSAAKFTTARTIDGTSFDGTANITVIAPGTHAATTKATPADADEIPLADSAASYVLKNLTWANLKATIKTYYDALATTLTNKTINCANNTCTVRLGSDVTGTVQATNFPTLTGDVTTPGSSLATTVTNSSVIAKVLTAFSAGAGTVSSSDSILTAFQKVVGNIALKADLASPVLTGVPTAPTASPATNTTQIATTAYADAIAALKANIANTILTGLLDIQGAVKKTGIVTPSQITSNQNDYNPSSAVCASDTFILSSDASRDVTGLAGGVSGCEILLINGGSNPIVLKDAAAGSSANNRFATGADITLASSQAAQFIYQAGSTNKWRYIGVPGTGGGGGGISSVACAEGALCSTITSSGTVKTAFSRHFMLGGM